MSQLMGGCLCRKVRYKVLSPPISQGICYCHECQKTGGAYGSPLMVLHKKQLEYSEDGLSFFETKSDRGSTVSRYFCNDCGSHIFSYISDVSELVTVKAVTLEDFKNFIPQYLVWTQSAVPDCPYIAGVPAFAQNAPMEILLGIKE